MNRIVLSRNLQVWEIECNCGCGFIGISKELVAMWQAARDLFGEPIQITSGCRCESHNKNIKGSPTSSHIKGLAMDVTCRNPTQFNLLRLAWCFGRAGIPRVCFRNGATFLHIDVDDSKSGGFFSY
jgi:uncharacterized protein YcbK (DUF882 family)